MISGFWIRLSKDLGCCYELGLWCEVGFRILLETWGKSVGSFGGMNREADPP